MNAIQTNTAIDNNDEADLTSLIDGLLGADLSEGEIDLSEELDASADATVATDGAVSAGDEEIEDVIDLNEEIDEEALARALAEIEQDGAMKELYAEQDKDAEVEKLFASPNDKPSEEKPKSKRKGKGKGKKDAAPKEEDEPKVAKEPKEPAAPGVRYNGRRTNADEVLKAKLGPAWRDMMVLEMADADLSPEELEAKQGELLKLLSTRPGTEGEASSQQKVAEKVVMLFKWLKDGGSLNKVMEITFKTLARDGALVTGKEGNLHKELLAKPYSPGTANAQGGQMASMLPMLKITTSTVKGRFVPNEDSVIWATIKSKLAL